MTDQTDLDDPPMSLVAHLTELRDRLLRAVLAVLIGFIILYSVKRFLANWNIEMDLKNVLCLATSLPHLSANCCPYD